MTHQTLGLRIGSRTAALVLCLSYPCIAADDPLAFDATKFVERTVTVGARSVKVRAYEGIVYVAKPVDASCQSVNVYIPAAYFQGGSIGAYNARTAPVFLPNMVGGYMPARPGTPGLDRSGGPNAISHALVRGYVVASPGARGWPLRDSSGKFIGKAPAAIVDLKAAVRWLRHNDKVMPGNAEKIISNGTSAGGALSALLGASGNHPDYEPYLDAIGAAHECDDIFAASCYCPITNLENADSAYEWLFHGIHDYNGRGGRGTLTAQQVAVSEQLRQLFPAYLNSLELEAADGSALTLNKNGEGSFKDYVKSLVIASAQSALAAGEDLSELKWITIDGKTVRDVDFEQYVRFAGRMKTPPAFDDLELRSPENGLFGAETTPARHFTQFSADHGADRSLAEPAVVRLMNPMNFIITKGAARAARWRIRHGVVDRDTSLAIPTMLAVRLRNSGAQVDFAMPWGQAHGGDYDLAELFGWMEKVCR